MEGCKEEVVIWRRRRRQGAAFCFSKRPSLDLGVGRRMRIGHKRLGCLGSFFKGIYWVGEPFSFSTFSNLFSHDEFSKRKE